jgi:hypothetical protein
VCLRIVNGASIMTKLLLFVLSHTVAAIVGFALGIYMLPLLTQPEPPSLTELRSHAATAQFQGRFRRDLPGSDFLHWGDGVLAVGPRAVSLLGELAPGPDYALYLSPEFVATEAEFQAVKERAVRLGDVRTFTNFIVPVPDSVDLARYNTVIVWCESFAQFITAAQYR